MSGVKLLSGTALIKKGLDKSERTLPVKGLKEVAPSGAWVQQKQIQLALDARRQLLADERVEKWGVLSHAVWEEDIGLARVTEFRGGHWVYMGHNRDSKLYIYPEEALFLIEVNCLELTFGGVQVSLQQAYSLLLKGSIKILEYRVYSELSRVGYRVLRFTPRTSESSQDEDSDSSCDERPLDANTKSTEQHNDQKDTSFVNMETGDITLTVNESEDIVSRKNKKRNLIIEPCDGIENTSEKNIEHVNEITDIKKCKTKNENINKDISSPDKQNGDQRHLIDNSVPKTQHDKTENNPEGQSYIKTNNAIISDKNNANEDNSSKEFQTKSNEEAEEKDWRSFPSILVSGPIFSNEIATINQLQKRKPASSIVTQNNEEPLKSLMGHNTPRVRTLSSLNLPDYFVGVPEIVGEDVVRVRAPDESYLPRNVFLNKTEYVLKIDEIVSKCRTAQTNNNSAQPMDNTSASSRNTSRASNDPVIEAIYRNQFFRNTFCYPPPPLPPQPPFMQFPYFMFPNRRFQRFSPRNASFRYGYMFSNPRSYFAPRYMPFPNLNMIGNQDFSADVTEAPRKRVHDDNSKKMEHLQSIRRLTCRLKKIQKLGHSGNWDHRHSLKKLVDAYNSRYNENIQISGNLKILNDCYEGETIDLEEDERLHGKRKRQKGSESSSSDKNNLLAGIKKLALRLKQLRHSGERCFRNRRSLLDAIKLYNKKFNGSIFLTSDFGIKDSLQIVLDSSSDSDCFVADGPSNEGISTDKKKHSLFIRQSKKIIAPVASTSKDGLVQDTDFRMLVSTKDLYEKNAYNFASWLPSMDDWGHPEVVPSSFCEMRILHCNQEQYLLSYLSRYREFEYRDWSHLKSEFWEEMKANQVVQTEPDPPQNIKEIPPCSIEPLLSCEDCADMSSALRKIRIIKTHSHQNEDVETTLTVTFDVYERDVKNFRKTDLPTPAFRLICIDERREMADACEVASLQASCGDAAPLVVAAVGSSVSYLQLAPADLPQNVQRRFL